MATEYQSFLDEVLASRTEDHIPRTFDGKRPRVRVNGKLVSIRMAICLRHRGPAPRGNNALVPFVTCDDPNCYNPRHIDWVPSGRASSLSKRIGKRQITF